MRWDSGTEYDKFDHENDISTGSSRFSHIRILSVQINSLIENTKCLCHLPSLIISIFSDTWTRHSAISQHRQYSSVGGALKGQGLFIRYTQTAGGEFSHILGWPRSLGSACGKSPIHAKEALMTAVLVFGVTV
jgi:hypothetical protein